jgi:hypothetical protein
MKRIFRNKLTANLIYGIINFDCRTSKIIRINENILNENREKYKNVIFAFWHGRQFVLMFEHGYRGVGIMTSLSEDGELQTVVMSRFRYDIVRGSAEKRGAVEGTIKLIEKVNELKDIAFAVDGPKGPGFKPKSGVIFIARKTGRPIIPVSSSARRKKLFNNWDKFLLPYPFNRCAVVYGKPIFVSREDNIDEKAEELEIELNRITDVADKSI